MRQKKGLQLFLYEKVKGTLGFCQVDRREAHTFMKIFGSGTGPLQQVFTKKQKQKRARFCSPSPFGRRRNYKIGMSNGSNS